MLFYNEKIKTDNADYLLECRPTI